MEHEGVGAGSQPVEDGLRQQSVDHLPDPFGQVPVRDHYGRVAAVALDDSNLIQAQ